MKHYLMAVALGLAQLLAVPAAMAHGEAEQQITHLMKQQFDRPDAPLTVEPIIVEGSVAVAAWLQGGRGGRALLQQEHGHWAIALCGGAGLTQADVLQSTGMKADAATRLASKVQLAESKLGADKRKLFDSFEGMLKIDATHGHGQSHGHLADHTTPAGH